MAYVKTNWETGDIITEEKLNHIEDGIAASGSPLVLHFLTNEAGTKDMYSGEEIQAILTGQPEQVVIVYDNTNDPEYPTYFNAVYSKCSVTEAPDHSPKVLCYARINDRNGDSIEANLLVIYADENGAVNNVEDGSATGAAVTYYEYTYNSESGYWEQTIS